MTPSEAEGADPASFEAARARLYDEIVMVRDAWSQYLYLFTEDPDRVRVLNACAPWVFGTYQRLLLRETILGVSRLTDELETGKYDNLVLGVLLLDPVIDAHSGLRHTLAGLVSTAVASAKTVRVHRNKYIAHLDKAFALSSIEPPLPGLTRAAITGAIEAIEAAFLHHATHTLNRHTFFDLHPMGGPSALVEILEKSDRWRRIRELTQPAE